MSRFRPIQLAALAACVVVTLVTTAADAQNPAGAEVLFEQARAAMAAAHYDVACARFRESDELDPAVGTRFNLADCEERRGRLATAWSLFRGVLSELSIDDDRRPIAQERADALEPRLPTLTLVVTAQTPRGLRVRLDGTALDENSFGVPLRLDPGKHELTLQSPNDGQVERFVFEAKEGQHGQRPLRLAPPPPSGTREGAAEGGMSSRQTWGYVASGVGLGAVAFGTVAGIVTLNQKRVADDNCSDVTRTCNERGIDANAAGKTYAALSGIGFGAGAVGLAVGAYLLLTSSSSARAVTSRSGTLATVVPQVMLESDLGFVGVAARF